VFGQGKTSVVYRCAYIVYRKWIPTFAGMTKEEILRCAQNDPGEIVNDTSHGASRVAVLFRHASFRMTKVSRRVVKGTDEAGNGGGVKMSTKSGR